MVEANKRRRLKLGRLLPRLVEDWEAAQQRRQSAVDATRRISRESILTLLAIVDRRLKNGLWNREEWNIFEVLGRTWREDAHEV